MTLRPVTLLATASFLAVLTVGLTSPALAEPETYELHIGKKKIDVVVGEPFRIELPGDVGFDALLWRPPHCWAGRVLRFEYPRRLELPGECTVDTHRPKGFLGWNVRCGGRILVRILAYAPGEGDPAKALAAAMRTVKEKLGTGTTVEKEKIHREIAGEKRTGRRLVAMIGDDPKREEVFAFRLGDRVFVVSFPWQEPTREKFAPAQKMVATTLARADRSEKMSAPEPKYTPDLELRVGERAYRILVDVRFRLETGEDEAQIAVLRRPPQTFSAHGLTFVHPGTTRAHLKNRPGRAMIQISHGLAFFMDLQYYLVAGVSRKTAQSLAVKHVKESVEKTGAKFGRDKTCRFRFLGKSRAGTRMTTVGGKDPYIIEIYSFDVGKRALSVLLFCRESNEKEARATFKMIADTLKKE